MLDLPSFGEKLISVLDRGSFTSTYKYAVLLGLIDLALERTEKSGAPPTSVTTEQLAERVIELYWPHARAFGPVERVLHQNLPQRGKRGNAEIVAAIERFRDENPGVTTPHRGRTRASEAWRKLAREVEWKLVEMPLPRVQTVGGAPLPFLYAIAWDDEVRRSAFNDRNSFDNSIRFLPGAAEALVRLSGLLRPLIQREWAGLVARFNELPDAKLEEFLFDADRKALGALREPLRELQRGDCFYCGRNVARRDVDVDHFIPWARHPNDAIENLVAAHRGCNGSKSDHFAATAHVERWLERADTSARELAQICVARVWPSDRETSLGVARGVYGRLPGDARLWLRRGEFEVADRARLARAFR